MVSLLLLEDTGVTADCMSDTHVQLVCDPNTRGARFTFPDSCDQNLPLSRLNSLRDISLGFLQSLHALFDYQFPPELIRCLQCGPILARCECGRHAFIRADCLRNKRYLEIFASQRPPPAHFTKSHIILRGLVAGGFGGIEGVKKGFIPGSE